MTDEAVREARKSFALTLKAADDEAGTFRALVSVFGVVDSYDEKIMPGAFAKSIEEAGDNPFPLVWHHKWTDITSYLGHFKAFETDEGLEIEAQVDMEDPNARKVYRLIKAGVLREFSIGGYEPSSGIHMSKENDRTIWEVHEFELVEVSVVIRGANPETRVIDVKSAADLIAATTNPTKTDPETGAVDGDSEKSEDADQARRKAAALITLITITADEATEE